ncbi:hypothetical protein CFK38_05315 [Brachybacterium vulturis]|uniref:Uncharacterized protein n=1 Tax=Brachybacterium vulturis TaxID=2017484 RepID=A0A291GKG9_9MICO|nr:DUF6541 family protein [Brachybacterium vulturis]ATG51013.1 hypothetical protein CFK38_05315 [Brachybacterium vulturis]
MWADVIPGILIAAAVLLVPGTAVLSSCRVHPVTAVVAAPAASLAVVALSTMSAWALGATWDVRWVVACTLVCVLPCALLSWGTPWGRRQPRHSLLSAAAAGQYVVGQVIGVALMAPLYLQAFISPDTIAQRYDNVFHLNAIEAIVRTGQATPMATADLVDGSLYPNGWHTIGALVHELSGLDIAPSVHALTLATVLGVWPLSMWLLIEALVRPSAVVRLICGPLILAFPGFPLVLLDWGLIYPTILGLATAPALAAALVHMIRHRSVVTAPLRTVLVIGFLGVGAGIAHPGAALIPLIMVLPLAVLALVRSVHGIIVQREPRAIGVNARHVETHRDGRLPSRGEVVWPAALAAIVLAIVLLWITVAPSTSTAPWKRFETAPQAVGEIVMGGVMGRPMVPVIAVITVFGVVGSIAGWTRDRWAMLAMIGPAAVYFSSAALENGPIRDLLSGFFYRDSFRTGAALTLGTVPVAVAALDLLSRHAATVLDCLTRRLRFRGRARRYAAAAVVTAVGLGASTSLGHHVSSHPQTEAQFENVSAAYRTWEYADLASADEIAMFEVLPEYVPENGYVIADPWEGGGLIYALGEREVNQIYMLLPRSEEERYFDRNFRRIAHDQVMCEVLPEDRPLFYLDLDEHRLGGNQVEWEGYQGYQGISEHTPGFTPIHEIGTVTLYRLTAC